MTAPAQGSPEWLAARLTGIGGSEISALYRKPDGTCANPWMTPTRLWGLKTGRIKDDQPTPQKAPHLYVGRVLEAPVREMYETFSGRTVTEGVTLKRDAEAPILLANTDGIQTCASREGEGVYEGKVTTVFRRKDWISRVEDPATGDVQHRELVPLHYRCQTQHYMGCDDKAWASVVCFMQGDRAPIHWRDLERHDAFLDDMRERAARWWRDHVVADVAPPVDDSAGTEAALRKMHREAEDLVLQLPAAFAAVLDRLEAIAEFSKQLKAERQRLRNILLSTMGSAALAVISSDGRGWSLRGKASRSLIAHTASGIERARARISSTTRAIYVPTEIAREVDALYTVSAQALAEGQSLSAKSMHLAHLAVLAAQSATE